MGAAGDGPSAYTSPLGPGRTAVTHLPPPAPAPAHPQGHWGSLSAWPGVPLWGHTGQGRWPRCSPSDSSVSGRVQERPPESPGRLLHLSWAAPWSTGAAVWEASTPACLRGRPARATLWRTDSSRVLLVPGPPWAGAGPPPPTQQRPRGAPAPELSAGAAATHVRGKSPSVDRAFGRLGQGSRRSKQA